MASPLDNTFAGLLSTLFPNESREYVDRIIRIASCLSQGTMLEKILAAADLLSSTPIALTEQLIIAGNFEFAVVAGRQGSIATAVEAATINAASTISVEYSLNASPVALDWKVYTTGSFTGQEVDKGVIFQGVLNRVVWVPAGGESLNIRVAL